MVGGKLDPWINYMEAMTRSNAYWLELLNTPWYRFSDRKEIKSRISFTEFEIAEWYAELNK